MKLLSFEDNYFMDYNISIQIGHRICWVFFLFKKKNFTCKHWFCSGRRIYWTDAKHDKIESADMSTGLNRTTIVHSGDQLSVHYYGIALDKNYIYTTDWTKEWVTITYCLLYSILLFYSNWDFFVTGTETNTVNYITFSIYYKHINHFLQV